MLFGNPGFHFACIATCPVGSPWLFDGVPEKDQEELDMAHKWLVDKAESALEAGIPEIWLYWPYSAEGGDQARKNAEAIVQQIKDQFELERYVTRRGRLNLLGPKLKNYKRYRFSSIYWGKK